MSVENAKSFLEKINQDHTLQERFRSIPTNSNALETGLQIAASEGFVFTAEEFKEASSSEGDLSDAELEGVNGGNFTPPWGGPPARSPTDPNFSL